MSSFINLHRASDCIPVALTLVPETPGGGGGGDFVQFKILSYFRGVIIHRHMHTPIDYYNMPLTEQQTTVETGLLAHALMGSIAELYTLIFENTLIIQAPLSNRMSL